MLSRYPNTIIQDYIHGIPGRDEDGDSFEPLTHTNRVFLKLSWQHTQRVSGKERRSMSISMDNSIAQIFHNERPCLDRLTKIVQEIIINHEVSFFPRLKNSTQLMQVTYSEGRGRK